MVWVRKVPVSMIDIEIKIRQRENIIRGVG